MMRGIVTVSEQTRPSKKLTSRTLSLIAVFAAMQAVVTVIPFSMAIGVNGSITLGVVTAPLFGLLLGPVSGGSAVAVGTLVGLVFNPSGAIFGPLTILPPALAALGAGCIREKRGYVPGTVLLMSVGAFYANPFGRESLFYPWLHIIALILAYSPLSKTAATYIKSLEPKRAALGIALAAFIGTLSDQGSGSAMGIWYFSLPPSVWNVIMFVYPIERIVTVIIVTIIGVPVYRRLRSVGLI